MDCPDMIAQVPLDGKAFGAKMAVELPIIPINHMNLFEMDFGLSRGRKSPLAFQAHCRPILQID